MRVGMPDRAMREVQAESVAYAVSAALGLDASGYSFGYVASWAVGEAASIVYVLGWSQSTYDAISPWLMFVAFSVLYFSLLVLNFVLYTIFIQVMPHRMNFDYVIIHGCGLLGGTRLTKLLSNRVDKAIQIYERCARKPYIIPSGGQGPDEAVSEAQAMTTYLVEHGIPRDHILPEDQSATTYENLANSKAIIDARPGSKKTALVSSNYHVYRCLLFAREVGLRCTGIGADVALYYWPTALIREFIAVFLTRHFLVRALIGYLLFVGPVIHVLFFTA